MNREQYLSERSAIVDDYIACGGSVYSEPVRVSARDWAEYQTRH